MSRQNPSGIPEDDIINPKLNVSCLDFLLIELVPLAQRITDQLHARDQALIEEFRRSKIFNSSNTSSSNNDAAPSTTNLGAAQPTPAVATTGSTGKGAATETTSAVGTSVIGGAPRLDNEETREAVFWRLDGLGYRVGQGLVERFSIGKPRPQSPLDAIKFICKDLWTLLFRKQIDNLKTNHRGVFVLTDARFQPISRMSVDRRAGPKAGEDALRRAQSYLYFPCGVIRGALQGLGIEATVTAETIEIPAATFQIKMKGAKA
ncbi:Putative transport protein particle (TRAPP) component [Septoria linicola]|uniref:Transport protein particle (TRAPP) component n=1 Tax=Septoria linicola TaxID=215465 RepID=A0A9Q9ASM4_9PEZI|nr:putative transport protein particle (TRAPP) component [Septoria linicola]USW51403.1 Putative transport protein particle (TRAPP) component [Septoria linicola]